MRFPDNCSLIWIDKCTLQFNDGSLEQVFSTKGKAQFDNGVGEVVTELQGLTTGSIIDQSFALATVKPLGISKAHFHQTIVEEYYILEGEIELKLDGKPHIGHPGSKFTIHPETTHQIYNTSTETPLTIFVRCNPAWVIEDFHEVIRPKE